MLDCIHNVFSAEGSNLSMMVCLVGSIILPFVSVDGKVGQSSMQAMKTLLTIDSDCMWRALLKGSDVEVPQRSLLPSRSANERDRSISTCSNSNFSQCCSELMKFADGLPEQSIIVA